jgi:ATP-binding cassette subfamily F protein uup
MDFPLLQIRNGVFHISEKPIFIDLNLKIFAGDKICLIGKNGCGKSSLMKIITSSYELDKGELILQKGITIGYLAQSAEAPTNESIYDFILKNIKLYNDEVKEEKKYLADIILDKLQLDGNNTMNHLSGGQLRRAYLAKSLVLQPDLLLLDEPTNHLDINSIEWLEEYIQTYPGGILCVSHDRSFLTNVTNKTIWLDRGRMRFHHKGFKDFEEWADQITEEEENSMRKLSRKLVEENSWLQGGVTGRRKRNQNRLRNLFALREKFKVERTKLSILSGKLKLPPLSLSSASKLIVEMDQVVYSYKNTTNTIIDGFSLRVLKGEKIGIIGPNGSGKSTFLKLITQELQPDSGSIRLGPNTELGYFDQNRDRLKKDKTLWETLCPNGGDTVIVGDRSRHVVAYLKDFLFDAKQAKDLVGALSGGEANRLLLSKILAKPGNLLILDEPTNDLDMDSLDMLLDLLLDYKGTLLLVSHDRDFLNKIVTRSLIFTPNGIIDQIGGYDDYQTDLKTSKKAEQKIQYNQEVTANKSSKASNKISYKLQYELDTLPKEIDNTSQQILQLERELDATPNLYDTDNKKFYDITEKIGKLKKDLESKENRWIELESLKEEKK